MRQYIRYAVEIPIEITLRNSEESKTETLKNVSVGGLCVSMGVCPGVGSHLLIRIPCLDPPFETRVEVVWCVRKDDLYDVGLRLLDPEDAFRVRMVEQVCHIEHYRNEVLALEGRRLSTKQAAEEWIKKYSASFPNLQYNHSRVRRFIRHPTDIRIESTLLAPGEVYLGNARDIGLGGLRLVLPVCPDRDSDIGIKVLYVQPPFETCGRVAWCKPRDGRYEVGIELTCWQEKGWLRVVEQICEIEQYRRALRKQKGHDLSVSQAAKEWYSERRKAP